MVASARCCMRCIAITNAQHSEIHFFLMFYFSLKCSSLLLIYNGVSHCTETEHDDVTSGAGLCTVIAPNGFRCSERKIFVFFCSSIITKKREINDYEAHLCIYCLY